LHRLRDALALGGTRRPGDRHRRQGGLEETAMAARHADYADYARSTWRFVPFVW
jgi:hypothetical protein